MIAVQNAFAALLENDGRPALITGNENLSYADVAERIDTHRDLLTTSKRLVVISGANTPDSVVAYLSAMALGHAVLLVPGDNPGALAAVIQRYDPDVVFDPVAGEEFYERRAGTRHELHPELSLLMSTSGSTGSPKLVRLSEDNVISNARSIADYLGISEGDRALTTLPMHYCYGLSVVNSHLLSGAGIVVTDLSVLDECLWSLATDAGVTSFAGVPYTFDLLDSTDFAARQLPALRHVTQAGGRMAPDRIASYARLGQQRGWDFYAMYGQTEATARMAYLPTDLAATRPETLGIPISHGSFRLDPVPESTDEGVGELVYAGPNVMMGYAASVDDLAKGRELRELRTGDLARRHDDGVYEWVGRRSRITKIYGLRIDLDEVEKLLLAHGVSMCCVSVGDRIHSFVDRHVDPGWVRTAISQRCGLPEHVVTVGRLLEHPRTASGKTDYAALDRQARLLASSAAGTRDDVPGPLTHNRVRDLYALLLARPNTTVDDSFTSLRGDSLSHVELSVRLGELGLVLPSDWHHLAIRELVDRSPPSPRHGTPVEMSILLRATAILLILGTHANLWTVSGGAHVLLAVVGYNFARFQLTSRGRLDRVRSGLNSVLQLALPCMVWIGATGLILGMYQPHTVFFLNGLLGSDQWTAQWQFWFLEVIIWTQVVVLALLSVPWIHRAERRWPFRFAMTFVAGSLAARYVLTGVEAGPTERYTPSIVLWCFALGWAVAFAGTTWQRAMLSILAAGSVIGFFGDPRREAVVIFGILLLIWVHTVPLPRWAARAFGVLAAASLYIYLTQWQIYPHLENRAPLLAVLASLAGALAYQTIWRRAITLLRRSRPQPR